MSHDAPFFYSMNKTTAILEEVAKQRVLDKENVIKNLKAIELFP